MSSARMAAADAAWLHMDRPVNELVVHAVLWFDEPLPDKVIREAIVTRLVDRYPRFGQRVRDSGAAAWWVDVPGFDPMSQVTRERLAAPADLAALSDRVSTLASESLAPDRPLWDIRVVDGYQGGTALVARMHHCIADGVALFRVLLSLSDEARDGTLGAPQQPVAAPPRRRRDLAAAGVKVAAAVATLVGLPPDRRTALRVPLGAAKTVRWCEPLPLAAVKDAARAAGATINDLVLAAVSVALHRRLVDGGGPVRDVRAVLPVNLRPLDQVEVELGNRFGLVFLALPLTGGDRVAIIRRRTSALKRSATAPVSLAILSLVGRAHRRVVAAVIAIFSAKASLVLTNVPGPRQELHLGGRRLAGIIAWPPQSGSIGLGVSVISYAGQLVVGVMADDNVSAGALVAEIRVELERLSGCAAPARR